MSESANRFFRSIKDADKLAPDKLTDLFVYYLTVELGQDGATGSQVDECFVACDLNAPNSTKVYLTRNSKGQGSKFVKAVKGYKLQRHHRELLSQELGAERVVAQTTAELRALEAKLPAGAKRAFLTEAIDCFEAGANRAAVVMMWILTMDHVFEFVLKHHRPAFNAALAANPDKRVKVVSARDDFGDLKEDKIIELCRAAGIISNDVRKILVEKLGTRNSSAHPSSIVVKRSKVIDFFEDLVTNVIQKYAI